MSDGFSPGVMKTVTARSNSPGCGSKVMKGLPLRFASQSAATSVVAGSAISAVASAGLIWPRSASASSAARRTPSRGSWSIVRSASAPARSRSAPHAE